jgi:uncharacterized protein YwbE
MTTNTANTSDTVEIRALRREVAELRSLIDERDVEQMQIETAIEYLLSQQSTFLYVLGAVSKCLLGDRKGETGGLFQDMLYKGERHPAGFRQALKLCYTRPERRWRQFGSKTTVTEKAKAHGIKVRSCDTTRGMIRRLWAESDALPGGVRVR